MGVTRDIRLGLLILIVFHIFIEMCTEAQTTSIATSVPTPYCAKPCINGKCKRFNTCSCKAGYLKNLTDPYHCLPVCKGRCPEGATCTAPGKCECGPGYAFESRKCDLTCSKSTNSVCLGEPGKCGCSKKLKKYTDATCKGCVARCDRPCGNGLCISPNVCDCAPEYDFDPNWDKPSKGPLCIPRCINCEGSCVAPNKCVCETPYETRNVSTNGGDCDCFSDCSGSQRICVKTICVLPNSNEYWWVYVLVAILILIAIASAFLLCFMKRRICRYNVNDAKTDSNPADCVTMSQITDSKSS